MSPNDALHSGGPGLRILSPALQRLNLYANFPCNNLRRSAVGRQQPGNRTVLECLSISSH